MEPRTLIVVEWATMAVFTWLIALGVSRAAWRTCRAPRWPLQGRWLLAVFMVVVAGMCSDVARVSLVSQIIDRHTVYQINWQTVIVRAPPLVIGPWLFKRVWTVGLIEESD